MQQVINILFTVPDFRGDFIVRIQLLPPGTIFIVHQVLNAVVPPCLIPGFILAIAGDGVERVGRTHRFDDRPTHTFADHRFSFPVNGINNPVRAIGCPGIAHGGVKQTFGIF